MASWWGRGGFWIGWAVACGAAWLVPWLLVLGHVISGDSFAVAVSLTLAAGQSWVLRKRVSARLWAPLTAVSWFLAFYVNGLVITGAGAALVGTSTARDLGRFYAHTGALSAPHVIFAASFVIQGAVAGALQYPLMRRLSARAFWWPLASAAGMFAGYLVSDADVGLSSMGVQYGAVTGVVLRYLAAPAGEEGRSASTHPRRQLEHG